MRFDVYCGMMFSHVIGSFRTVAYDVGVKLILAARMLANGVLER